MNESPHFELQNISHNIELKNVSCFEEDSLKPTMQSEKKNEIKPQMNKESEQKKDRNCNCLNICFLR